MDVVDVRQVIVSVAHTAVGESSLPDGKLRPHTMGEASFDELDGSFDGDVLGRKQQMNVVGHYDERVKLVMTFAAVVLQRFKEELRISSNLKKAMAVVGGTGDEERPVACSSAGDGHGLPSVPQGLKPVKFGGMYGTAKAMLFRFLPQPGDDLDYTVYLTDRPFPSA